MNAKAPTKPKTKGKAKRARPRRRGADSDDEDEAGHASDDSLTSASDLSDSDEDEDQDDGEGEGDRAPASKPIAGPSKNRAAKKPAAFADVSSTTPAVWADEKVGEGEAEEISFDEFNRGESASMRGAKRGRGRGRGGIAGAADAAPREKKVFTEEQTRKYEEKKAKMKAKKAALREAKKKEQEEAKKAAAAGGDEPKAEGVKGDLHAAEGSTSAVQAEKIETKTRKPKAKKDAVSHLSELE